MDVETQIQRTSPILRITTDITELKLRESKESRLSETSPSEHSEEASLQHASKLLQKKKQLRPLFGSPNPYRSSSFYSVSPYSVSSNSKSNVSPFTQRVMSAKLLRVKKLQNELKETQIQLHEAVNENRILKTLQKRQDNALKKYEGDQAQLPQLIKSHNNDLRVVSTQYKQLKGSYRELEQKLRQRDMELANLKDQHRHLIQLSRDKHLGQREKLMKQVEDLQETVKEQSEKIQLLTRRVELEGKNYKHQLTAEMTRHKETQADLTMAHETIETLKNLIEAKDKYINNSVPNRYFKQPIGNVQILSSVPSTTRLKSVSAKIPDPDISQVKPDYEDIKNTAGVDLTLDTDVTSEFSSANINNRKISSVRNLNTESMTGINFRKKLLTRKSRMKSTLNSNSNTNININDDDDNNVDVEAAPGQPNLQNSESEHVEQTENDSETPQYSSSFPSINNSDDSVRYNTDSDTPTKIGLTVKSRRRVSIDSAKKIISDSYKISNMEEISCKSKFSDDLDESDRPKGKTNKRVPGEKKSVGSMKMRLRRDSSLVSESDEGMLESIEEALEKVKKKDKVIRKQKMDEEIKSLEEKLRKNNCDSSNEVHTLDINNEDSVSNLLDKRTQKMKDELKEFEERLLKTNNLGKYSRSFEDEANEVVKNITTGFDLFPDDLKENNDSESVNSGSEFKKSNKKSTSLQDVSRSWEVMNSKFQQEKDETDMLLSEYYKKMMLNNELKVEDDKEEEEEEMTEAKDVDLHDNEKQKLLKALKEIDLEKTGRRNSSSDSDGGHKERSNSLNCTIYDFNSTEGFNKGRPFNDYEFPSLNSGNNNDTTEFTQDFENSFIKNKNDLMEELFGKNKSISILDQSHEHSNT